MQISYPIIHLEKNSEDLYFIHVITWFDSTKFVSDGYDTLPTTAVSNVFKIKLFVAEDAGVPEMQLLTPVVHTITLDGVSLSNTDPFFEVEIYNTTQDASVSKRKGHKDSAGDSAMPDPGSVNRPS